MGNFNFCAVQAKTFAITGTKIYVPVVILLTSYNTKMLQQLKSGSKRTIKWNKYQSKVTIQRQNQYLDYSIDPGFQGAYKAFGLSFESRTEQDTQDILLQQ